MQAAILFGVILVILAFAFAVPMGRVRGREIDDRDASVLGASILVLGLGVLNLAFVVWFVVTGEIDAVLLVFGLAPLAAGAFGLLVVRSTIAGSRRTLILIIAPALTLAGLPGYFALNVAILLAAIAAISFLGGLLPNPRALVRLLDPRL
jgi:hypothetical protein